MSMSEDDDHRPASPRKKSSRRMSGTADDVHGAQVTTPLLRGEIEERPLALPQNPAFQAVVASVETAIERGILPSRIEQGSSGSYFCRDISGTIVGVFKPKNEEPYGSMNPKWGKYFQRVFCPCCFGRGCLLPNQGYLSEAGASLVDTVLKLSIVPKTHVVKLTSTSFHYSRLQRARVDAVRRAADRFPDMVGTRVRQGLPPKRGSFQLFVNGYKEGSYWLKRLEMDKLSPATRESFQMQFEALVCLDYIIRNTDRGDDNWLIKYTKEGAEESISIAAIDNGLAFPYKHPDHWRAYPFHWAWLPAAKQPFSEATAAKLLPLLSDEKVVEGLVSQLHQLFKQDPSFSRAKFARQMGVMRGQIINLRAALQERRSPLELVQMAPASIVAVHTPRGPGYIRKVGRRMPFFSWC